MKEVRSTESLYGVHPQDLANMTYKQALEAKKAGLLNRKKNITDEMFVTSDHQRGTQLQEEYKRIMKALAIVEADLELIK